MLVAVNSSESSSHLLELATLAHSQPQCSGRVDSVLFHPHSQRQHTTYAWPNKSISFLATINGLRLGMGPKPGQKLHSGLVWNSLGKSRARLWLARKVSEWQEEERWPDSATMWKKAKGRDGKRAWAMMMPLNPWTQHCWSQTCLELVK